MEKKRIRSYRWFWPWQDREEEVWLEEMSRSGFHLASMGLASYSFEAGEPVGYAYRLDARSGQDLQEYLGFCQDAGWEHLGQRFGWHYFRQARAGREHLEIHTDTESKIQKYRSLLFALLTPSPLSMVVFLAAFKKFPGRHPPWLVSLVTGIFVVWTVYAVAVAVQVWRRIEELKRARPL